MTWDLQTRRGKGRCSIGGQSPSLASISLNRGSQPWAVMGSFFKVLPSPPPRCQALFLFWPRDYGNQVTSWPRVTRTPSQFLSLPSQDLPWSTGWPQRMSGTHASGIKRNDWLGKSWLMSRGRKWVGGSGYMCSEREPHGAAEHVFRSQTAWVWVPVLPHAGQQIKPVASLFSPIKERH